MRYSGLDESKIIKKKKPESNVDSGFIQQIDNDDISSIPNVVPNVVPKINTSVQLENDVKIKENVVLEDTQPQKKEEEYVTKTIKSNNDFPVFFYDKNTSTNKVEATNKKTNKEFTFSGDIDRLKILNVNNEKEIFEMEFEIEILKLLLCESKSNKEYYDNKLNFLNNEIKILYKKREILNKLI